MTEQSPVVPSVGAVPEDVDEAAQLAAQAAVLQDDNTWPDIIRCAVEAAYPLIAARVRAELVQAIRAHAGPKDERGVCVGVGAWPDDRAAGYTAAVDEIVEEVLGAPVGEALAAHDARVRAEERQRMLAAMEQPAFMQAAIDRAQLTTFTDDGGHDIGIMPGSHAAVAIIAARTELLAAGSAVPVATPTEPASCRCPTIEAYLAAPGAARAVGASFGCPVHGDRSDEAEAVLSARRAEQDGQR